MDNQDSIRLEAVSFKTPGNPKATFGLDLPDSQSISVEVTVTPPEGSVVFTSHDQIMLLAWVKLSWRLDAMSSHARDECRRVGS